MIAGKPVVFVVDDDPVSLAFLAAAVERCGCAAMTANDVPMALGLPADGIDLLLIDRNLPGSDGTALLHALRARGIDAPAVATSADLDDPSRAALTRAGFEATLPKPASLDSVQALLARFLGDRVERAADRAPPSVSADPLELLDDAAALAAIGGDPVALQALRGLFAVELDALVLDLDGMHAGLSTAVADRLHRLRASCGFCGAAALATAALRLEGCLRHGLAHEAALAAFTQTCSATRRAIAAHRPA